jgi:MFS family permease
MTGLRHGLVGRRLEHYPDNPTRYALLGIVVAMTIVLYYLYYVEGAVTPLLLPGLHMSFSYFLYMLVASNAVGAFTAFIGGLSDKIGRANLAVYGLLAVGLLQLVAIPHIHTELAFAIVYTGIGFVEGIILVVTPAMMRDFSPQMGRATAMGFWALGPTAGSLVASLVANHTLTHLHPYQDQFIISGTVCVALFVIAFAGLRELAPGLRDQLMVSLRERALIEARAKGLDVDRALAHPMRSMLRLDLLTSSFAVSVFLLIYFASVSVLTLYWAVVFNQSTANANGLNTWYWSFDSVTLVLIGLASDRLRVRKPFMLVGGVGTLLMTILFLSRAHHPSTPYYDLAVLVSLLGFFIAIAYTPWMANYSEAVEARNPALAATGLAVWGWVLRIVVAASFLVLPHVITTATTLVDNQGAATDLQAFQAAAPYAPSTTNVNPPPAPASVLSALESAPAPAELPARTLADVIQTQDQTHNLFDAINDVPYSERGQIAGLLAFQPIAAALQKGIPVTAKQLATVGASSPQLRSLLDAETLLLPAQKESPSQWQHWWWVCVGGEALFLVLIFAMRGRWSPRAAKADFDAHERLVEAELAAL